MSTPRHLLPILASVLLFTALLFPPSSQAQPRLPEHSAVPGGVALVPVNSAQVKLGKRRIMVVPSRGTEYETRAPYVAVVGVDLSTKPGIHTIRASNKTVKFEVQDKNYREQRLTIKNKRHVNPEKRDMDRIGRERTEMLTALGNWRDDLPPVTRFQLPAQGPFSSPFGLKRFFNDQPRAPHSGLDIAAPKGAPITAPAPGIVTAAGDYFFNGRNVVLDHGHGLVTMYSHMDEISVEVGDQVDTGELLGTIGNSGRVTGPHLHWTVSLNNVRVDPMLFIDAPAIK